MIDDAADKNSARANYWPLTFRTSLIIDPRCHAPMPSSDRGVSQLSYKMHNDKVESQMRVFDVPEKSRPLSEHEKGQIAVRKNMERTAGRKVGQRTRKSGQKLIGALNVPRLPPFAAYGTPARDDQRHGRVDLRY